MEKNIVAKLFVSVIVNYNSFYGAEFTKDSFKNELTSYLKEKVINKPESDAFLSLASKHIKDALEFADVYGEMIENTEEFFSENLPENEYSNFKAELIRLIEHTNKEVNTY